MEMENEKEWGGGERKQMIEVEVRLRVGGERDKIEKRNTK